METLPARPSAIPGYADWPAYVRTQPLATVAPRAQPVVAALGVPAPPRELTVATHWQDTHDGVTTAALSWQLGFGPVTRAWLSRPAGVSEPLPGVLALHCHGGTKYTGASRLVAFPPGRGEPGVAPDAARQALYGGRALATELARTGCAVLAHDTFAWGSRRFPLAEPPWRTAQALAARRAQWRQDGVRATPEQDYDAAAAAHEDTVAQVAGLLGTSLAGMVAHDDLAALAVLGTLPGVDAQRLGCLGFSGGGGRSLVLAALAPAIRGYVVTAMMTTFASLLPAHTDAHSWLLQTPGLARVLDWPELAAVADAPAALMQYAAADPLFPLAGMRAADAVLTETLGTTRYRGAWWPGGHDFTAPMQEQAFAFLHDALAGRPQ